MSYFLAIDAGGTKTDYVLADETEVLARVRTGTIKRMRTDATTATRNLDSALAELAALSGVTTGHIAQTCIGTAGERVPMVADFLRTVFAERVPGGLLLLGDVEIALDAAFPGQPGVLVLAGTGSNVAGRTRGGRLVNAGGWGPALADQGSGHLIGHSALRATFMAVDESQPTLLLQAFLDHWQLGSIAHLVEHANRIPAPDFSRLTELVVAAAAEGDHVAQAVLRRQGEDLAYLVRLVMRQLRAAGDEPAWTPPIACAGSIMEKVQPVREALIASVQQEFPAVEALPGVVDPIAGALWRARHAITLQEPTA